MIDTNDEEFEKKHLRNLRRKERELRKLYEDAFFEIAIVGARINYNGKVFRIKDYPELFAKIQAQIKKLHANILGTVINSIEESWDLSNKKNNLFVDKRLAGKTPTEAARQILYDSQKGALKQFILRKEKGLNLSDRVWNTLDNFKTEMEQALSVGINEGKSAAKMATQMKQYLNNPDKLFRKVRTIKGDKSSPLKLSKAAKEYHPGQGVYRSSFMNAKRLTATETNMAYRSADSERWKNLPFVKGIEVKLSNNHPKYDICDELKGKYPRDFTFRGWHPFCRCYAVAVQVSEEEYQKIEDALLSGEGVQPKIDMIQDPPKGFSDYVEKNKERIEGWKNKPYWAKDNPDYYNAKEAVKEPAKPAFTPAKSIEEAAERIRKSGVANSVTFKGWDLEGVNNVLPHIEKLGEVKNRLNIPVKINGLGDYTSLGKLVDPRGKANDKLELAKILNVNDSNYMLISKTNLGNAQNVAASLQKLNNSGMIKDIDLEGVLLHEFGHAVHYSNPINQFADIRDDLQDVFTKERNNLKKYIHPSILEDKIKKEVGSYILSQPQEFFAESFRLYVQNKLPESMQFVKPYFDKLFKK